jgi:hypothetical protein
MSNTVQNLNNYVSNISGTLGHLKGEEAAKKKEFVDDFKNSDALQQCLAETHAEVYVSGMGLGNGSRGRSIEESERN